MPSRFVLASIFRPCGGRASVDPVCEQHGQAQEAQFRRVPGTYCLHAQGSALDSCMTNSHATQTGQLVAVWCCGHNV